MNLVESFVCLFVFTKSDASVYDKTIRERFLECPTDGADNGNRESIIVLGKIVNQISGPLSIAICSTVERGYYFGMDVFDLNLKKNKEIV